MPELSTLLSGAALLVSSKQRSQRNQIEEGKEEKMEETREFQNETVELLREQLRQQSRTEPSADAIDAFYGTFINDIKPGETVIVEITPLRGYDLYVDTVYVDRRADFEYDINLNGNVQTGANEFDAMPPRLVTQHGKVTVRIKNDSSSSEDVDLRLKGWAEVR